MDVIDDQQLSDDEIFVGEFTLKEVKKRLLYDRSSFGYLPAYNTLEDGNKSVKIIETHSTPNIISPCDNPIELSKPMSSLNLSLDLVDGQWDVRPDDSFLRLEKLVSTMNVTPSKITKKQAFSDTEDGGELISINKSTDKCYPTQQIPVIIVDECKTPKKLDQMQSKSIPKSPETPYTPCKSAYSTPSKNMFTVQGHNFATPSSTDKNYVFKTPGNPVSHKKKPGSHVKKPFEHVMSPVASYIKNSPSVPLIKDVRPKKPLPGASCIPKLIKSATKTQEKPNNVTNKENTKLPTFAYKSAKETKVINIPDKGKLPQSQWAKQVASSIPRALVIKHDHREGSGVKKVLSLSQSQENSFADLSMHQADVSVCTQQSAVKVHKPLK